jgi:membrane-associated protease RseP (regulator of RpoE activity)
MATASQSTALQEATLPDEAVSRPALYPAIVGADLVVPVLLFIATALTTCMMGARFAANFAVGLPPIARDSDMFPISWIFSHPARLALGIPFAATILAILLAHEMGHYFACRRHGVYASLPYFLPAPTLSGTAGALIRLRSRVPNLAALLDIGFSGPLWGFAVCLPLSFLGLLLSAPSATGTAFISATPPAFWLLNSLLHLFRPDAPPVSHLLFHPVLLACWIGMFITFLNLLPAGQLDGGHILYSIFPRTHRRVTFAVVLLLVIAGVFLWIGWLFWAALLLLPFMRHPKTALVPPLSRGQRWLPLAGLLLLLLTMMPAPFTSSSLLNLVR